MILSIDLGDPESWTPPATPRATEAPRGSRARRGRCAVGDVAAAGPELRVGTGAPGVLIGGGPDPFTTTLGLLDVATGRIAVFGTGGPWAGGATCANDDWIVACGVVGDLAVRPLPPSARG